MKKLRGLIKRELSAISPKATTYLMYYYNFHKVLNLKNPQGINEKLQYLKLKAYYNNPVVTQCVDKYRVRQYLQDKGLSDLLPALYGAYDTPQAFLRDWDNFPKQMVIKCNHGSGYNILIKEKETANQDEIAASLSKWMAEDYWKVYCEPQYKYVKKKITVEEYLGDDIATYKFYCFHSVPKVAYISANGENGEKDLYLDYFSPDWGWLDISLDGHLHAKTPVPAPENLDQMIALSKELSQDFPFVRVDLYSIDGVIKFSELTFIPTGGNMKLKPETTIEEWGRWLTLD